MENGVRTITAPMSVGEWLAYWNDTHHVDGLLGLLHGIHRIRPEEEDMSYAQLLRHLAELARRVVFTGNPKEDAKHDPLWQEVYCEAAKRLIFSVMGRGLVSHTMDYTRSHQEILKFLGEGLINVFSQQQHLEAACGYLDPMISSRSNSWSSYADGQTTTLAKYLGIEIIHAASAWGLTHLFLTRTPRLTPNVVIETLGNILRKNNYDPSNSLSPDRSYNDLDLPHHVTHGPREKFGTEFALYRTARVYLMLQQREKERVSVAVP